jgi:hypothetical protein
MFRRGIERVYALVFIGIGVIARGIHYALEHITAQLHRR